MYILKYVPVHIYSHDMFVLSYGLVFVAISALRFIVCIDRFMHHNSILFVLQQSLQALSNQSVPVSCFVVSIFEHIYPGGQRQQTQPQSQQQQRRRGMTRDPRVWARYWRIKLSNANRRSAPATSDSAYGAPTAASIAADAYKATKSEMWLAAISEAESWAQVGSAGGGDGSANGSTNGSNQRRSRRSRPSTGINGAAADDKSPKLQAAGYLKHLRNLLEGNTEQFDHLPNFNPPPPRWDADLLKELEGMVRFPGNGSLGVKQQQEGAAGGEGQVGRNGSRNQNPSRLNRYSAFDSDDEDDDDDDASSENDDNELSDEEIVFQPTNPASLSATVASTGQRRKRIKMAMRRILVRILASQADIHAHIAIEHSRARPVARWLDGADAYEVSFNVLTSGQLIIDTQYAKLLQEQEDMNDAVGISPRDTKRIAALERKKADLADDSEIIAVSLSSFVRNRERYISAANSRIEYLESRLYQNQQSREEVRQAMGERWVNNPNAKGDYAERKRRMEDELRQAQQGVERIGRMNLEQMVRTNGAGGGRSIANV